ncbi:MAG: hypothetical protein R8P61_06355 [Bacteroidia bacterium]|nr:hypothetical protein [Bacteroidia bacterium]
MSWIGISCGPSSDQSTSGSTEPEVEIEDLAAVPNFTISIEPVNPPAPIPGFHSFAWARQGNKMLLIGGRTNGFHGLSQRDTVFKSSKANSGIHVIDLDTYSLSSYDIQWNNPMYLQFSSSNMAFLQDGDTLFLAGGYGRNLAQDIQSNVTIPRMLSLQVSTMIEKVEQGVNPFKSLMKIADNTPFVQVSGGELQRNGEYFYLMFGQNYDGVYVPGKTGKYTGATRVFKFGEHLVYDTSSYSNQVFRRRDINVTELHLQSGANIVAYGGVFTPNDGGYVTPVSMMANNGAFTYAENSLQQISNQYTAPLVSVVDQASASNTHVILGGIGESQLVDSSGVWKWEKGDNGAKLPFVKSITQMSWQNNQLTQKVQMPPNEPQLPELLGSNAIFFADQQYIYEGNSIDLSKVPAGSTTIGWFFGGIESQKPTSSMIFPTKVNSTIYAVKLNR